MVGSSTSGAGTLTLPDVVSVVGAFPIIINDTPSISSLHRLTSSPTILVLFSHRSPLHRYKELLPAHPKSPLQHLVLRQGDCKIVLNPTDGLLVLVVVVAVYDEGANPHDEVEEGGVVDGVVALFGDVVVVWVWVGGRWDGETHGVQAVQWLRMSWN
jgi:hypothetical protein